MTLDEIKLEGIREAASAIVDFAKSQGVILTIEQKPLEPFAMGHYETVVSVRAARAKC